MMSATDIAARLDLRRYPRSWRGRCPCCEYRVNTFSVRSGRNGIARLFCANGCTTDDLTETVARKMGQPTSAPRSDTAPSVRQWNRERALALWRGSEPATGTLVDLYLTARGLPCLAASSALRFRGDTPHPDYPRLPAMIALVSDVSDSPIGIHRTYLGRNGSKASVEPAKASLGPIWGGAIRLRPLDANKPLLIGEGIETAASAGRLMGLPAWASISAGNLAKGLALPPEAHSVVIAADPDNVGRDAARDAWLRWKAEGREVRIAIPDRDGADFNDLLLARRLIHA